MKRNIRIPLVLAFNALLIFLMAKGAGTLPPLGGVLNPFFGVWQNGKQFLPKTLKITELDSTELVKIYYDKNEVPHLVASSPESLYFAQGFIHAYHRLFQMDLQNRAGGGSISELVGKRTLKLDQFFVRIGMRDASKRSLEAALANPQTKLAIESYAKGVNAYISSLSSKDYPMEYKLLGTSPAHFSPLNVTQFLKIMSYRLAGKSFDLELTRLANKFGTEKVKNLFPSHPPYLEPIVIDEDLPKTGAKTKKLRSDFVSQFHEYPEYLSMLAFPGGKSDEGFNGSNNWAVSPNRAKNKKSILSNDTHLSYSLPNIWYEMQLMGPDSNVYGASFPGAPGIIIGANKNIAWGVTNATMDTMDFYEYEFKDESFSEYKWGDEWRKTTKNIERIDIKGGVAVKEKMIWTHNGPVLAKKGKYGLVMRWTAHDPTNELEAFLGLNEAKNFKECRSAISKFKAPAQNFICIDDKKVGIVHNGKMAKKKWGQGQFIMDGSNPENDWQEFIEFDELPQVNGSRPPKRGFVYSANQHSASKKYPYYLGWYYADPYRSGQIRKDLEARGDHTFESMLAIQNNSHDMFVEKFREYLYKNIDWNGLTKDQLKALQDAMAWNLKANYTEKSPSLLYIWWRNLRNSIWQDQLYTENGPLRPMQSMTLELVKQATELGSKVDPDIQFWLDDVRTEEQEDIKQLVNQSFKKTWDELEKKFGPYGEKWNWQYVNPSRVAHIAKIPGLGSGPINLNGSKNAPNVNTGTHGASWKMIVELNPRKMWINMPGGVSGNPFDETYDKFIDSWAKGEMHEAVIFEEEPSEAPNITIVGIRNPYSEENLKIIDGNESRKEKGGDEE